MAERFSLTRLGNFRRRRRFRFFGFCKNGNSTALVEVDRYAKKAGKRIRSVSKQTLQLFQSYSWPGNVRELQNVIERAVIVCDSETLRVDASWFTRTAPISKANRPFSADLATREKAMI